MTSSSLAQKTIQHVASKLESGEAAGLSEIVELIQKLSGSAYETSVQELATLIGKDVVVTAKVIAAANTIGYNPTGVEVSTITQAIHVIGFNKIRQLTVSLLLVENANRTLNPKEKREIAAIALCSGLMAESVMSQRGTLSPEQAFICASLRSYGRLLMTSFMIEDYRRAREMATEGITEDEAFDRVFGLTPLELGFHLLSSAHLPEAILKSLKKMPPGLIRSATEQPDLELLALSDLSVRACELALREDIGAVEFQQQAGTLAARSGRLFGLDSDGIVNVLEQTGQQLHEFANTFGLRGLSDHFGPRIRARVLGDDPAGYEAAVRARRNGVQLDDGDEGGTAAVAAVSSTSNSTEGSSAPVTPTGTEDAPGTREAAFQQAFQNGIEQLAGLLEEEPVNMKKVYGVILRSALLGFQTQDVVIFVRDARSRRYTPAFGSGNLFRQIGATASVKEEDRDVFGLCLQRLEDVLIYDAAEAKISTHLPPWIRSGALASFVLLPIQENRRPFALLLAGWPEKKTARFTVSQIRHVRSMLKLAGTARKLANDA